MKRLAALLFAITACQSDPAPPSTLLSLDGSPQADTSTADGSTPNDAKVEDSTVVDAAPCKLANPPADATCATCLQTSCCAESNACLGDPDCVALVKCIAACLPDSSSKPDGSLESGPCLSGCNAMHIKSRNAAAHYGTCVSASCSSQCPF